jgi:heme exporter protein B
MMEVLRAAAAVLRKDLRGELRTRYALSSILLFALASVALVSFTLKGEALTPRQHAALVWVVVFFAAATGLARGFVQEADAGTELLLRQAASPEAVWLGKLLFNLALLAAVEAVIFPVYCGLMYASVEQPAQMAAVAALGAVAISGCTTILGAMVARARSRSSVFALTALPILLPALLLLVQASAPAFGAGGPEAGGREAALAVVSYTGILMVLSWLLFPAVWEE